MPTLSGSTKAPLYATFGTMRFGATRFGYHSARVFVSIGGTYRDVMLGSLEITDELDEIPNTCRFRCVPGYIPTKGQALIVTLGSKNNGTRLFAGRILEIEQALDFHLGTTFYDVSGIDDTWLLGKLKVTGRYTNTSATAIVEDLIGTYASGFTTRQVAAGLALIDEITFTEEDLPNAISRVMKRIGGYWYVDEHQDLHAWVGAETLVTHPTDLTNTHLSAEHVRYRDGLDGLVTRVYVEGRGSRLLGAVLAGDTLIPLEAVDMFAASGEFAKLSFQGSDGGAQYLTFTGVVTGGEGAIAGPGVTPSTAMTPTAAAGAGIESGVHDYAYSWVTASGETLPSPLARVTHGDLTAPTTAPFYWSESNSPAVSGGGIYAAGDSVVYKQTFSGATGSSDLTNDTAAGPSSTAHIATESTLPGTNAREITTYCYYSSDARVTWTHVWRSINAAAYTLVVSQANLPGYAGFYFVDGSGGGGAGVPAASPAMNRSAIAGVPNGPAGTTAKKVWRTTAAGTQLKLQQTIANNTATTGVEDSTADASLGANAPTGDTSALHVEVENGGGFYTSVTGFATNGAATVATSAAPVFTSATYNFVAADVGAYLYVKAGANWTVGRYRIVSVAANAATLDAACASVASPTNGTWGVDYSTLASARIEFTDLVINGANKTQFTSAASPVGDNFIGNVIAIRDGIGFIVQRVIVSSRSGTTGVADKDLGAFSSTAGMGNLGGATASAVITAGSTTLLLAAAFATTSGWVVIGNGEQVVRYTGVSGNSLTGIPASGIGSIRAAISYGSSVTACPMLTGIPASGAGAIQTALAPGDEVYLVVQRDDTTAQAILAAYVGGTDDGVREDWIQDRRLSITEATARGDATLALRSSPEARLSYTSRDLNTRSGRTITLNLASPSALSGALKIQRVTISDFHGEETIYPTFAAEASSTRFSFEDLVRTLRKAS